MFQTMEEEAIFLGLEVNEFKHHYITMSDAEMRRASQNLEIYNLNDQV